MNTTDSEAGSKRRLKPRHTPRFRLSAALAISLLVMTGTLLPHSATALSVGDFFATIRDSIRQGLDIRPGTLQTISLAQAATNLDPVSSTGGGDITIVDDSALLPEEGPAGTLADIEKPKNDAISTYVVHEGDTISSIAKLFGVTPNTIVWANDLKRGQALKVGQTLVILPVTGVKYTVRKGDTLASIAKRYKGDADEIASFNEINGDLRAGDEIIIPDGEVPVLLARGNTGTPSRNGGSPATLAQIGYYLRPVSGIRTQGLHGYNGVDIAAPAGTPIYASAPGRVIVARGSGYNGGYGQYVVIEHDNGSQTLYAHASRVVARVGEYVERGQLIAHVGSTGKSTGSHVHFEIRNGIRNPF